MALLSSTISNDPMTTSVLSVNSSKEAVPETTEAKASIHPRQ